MIISVLSLTIFSVLTLITSHNEKKLSLKSAAALERYYAADMVSTRTLAEIKGLVKLYPNADILVKSLPDGIIYEQIEEMLYMSYGTPLDERQTLSATVLVKGQSVQVLEWMVMTTAEWSPSSSLDYWTGD